MLRCSAISCSIVSSERSPAFSMVRKKIAASIAVWLMRSSRAMAWHRKRLHALPTFQNGRSGPSVVRCLTGASRGLPAEPQMEHFESHVRDSTPRCRAGSPAVRASLAAKCAFRRCGAGTSRTTDRLRARHQSPAQPARLSVERTVARRRDLVTPCRLALRPKPHGPIIEALGCTRYCVTLRCTSGRLRCKMYSFRRRTNMPCRSAAASQESAITADSCSSPG